MSNEKCCRIKNSCGNNDISLINQTINTIKNQGEITTLGGYYSEYLIRQNKKILVNFGIQPGNSIVLPPAFIRQTAETTKQSLVNLAMSDLYYKRVGSIDMNFETRYQEPETLLNKIKACFNDVISHTNLVILYCNTGDVNDPILTDEQINSNYLDDIEVVLKVIFESPIGKPYGGVVSYIGKYNTSILQPPIPQRIFINNFTNKISYIETRNNAPDNLKIIKIDFEFEEMNFLPTKANIKNCIRKINLKIGNIYTQRLDINDKLFFKPFFDIKTDTTLPGNNRYISIFKLFENVDGDNPPIATFPDKCEIFVNGVGQRNSFGLGKDPVSININDYKEENRPYIETTMHTLYYNDVKFTQDYTNTYKHEFMHVLGCMHEQYIKNDTNPYYKYRDDFKNKNDALFFDTDVAGDFSYDSVMLYTFKRCQFKFFSMNLTYLINTRINTVLSQSDKDTLSTMYPIYGQMNENYTHKQPCIEYTKNIFCSYLNFIVFTTFIVFIIILLCFI